MLDAAPSVPAMQRARGAARVALGAGGLMRLAQAGSAKAFLPRVHGAEPEVVFLNTAGGLTGGDRMAFSLTLAPGARAVATTQTAERVYRSAGGTAAMEVTLEAGEGADLAWLPQETILFEGAALRRRTVARLSGSARLLICEIVVLGRAAMGETVARVDCLDCREVLRDGLPVLMEPLHLTDAALARGGGPAMLAGARAMATVALVAPGAEDAVGPVRQALGQAPGQGLGQGLGADAAASGWNGKCVVRVLAPGAREVRRAVAAALSVLGPGRLPRVWAMGGI